MRLCQQHRLPIVAVILTLLFGASFAIADEPVAKAPRCALIDVDKSPMGGLIEAEVLTRDGEDWLERSEIDKLLQERELQSLFTPGAGSDRRALGQTLKADVLVILKTSQENGKNKAELVVAETSQGLRLVSQQMLLGPQPEEDAKTLVSLIDQGIAKSRRPIKQIFAVPPFVSDDLTYEYDYLKSTYAKLLEQSLLDAPDVLVVELAEALAIANENKLTSTEGSLKRQLPIYLLGKYRNETKKDKRLVQLSVQAQQGSKTIDDQQAELSPEAVPEFLQNIATKIAKSQGIVAAPSDPETEAKQLNERAELFIRLGNWEEALGLIEASLLLKPDQPEMHDEAIKAASQLASGVNQRRAVEFVRSQELKLRSLEHLAAIMAKYPVNRSLAHFDLIRCSIDSPMWSYGSGSAVSDQLTELERKYEQEKQEIAWQMFFKLADEQNWKWSGSVLREIVASATPDDRYSQIILMILKYQNRENVDSMVREFAHSGFVVGKLRTFEGRRFLKELANRPDANDQVKQTARQMLVSIGTLPETKERGASSNPNDQSRLTYKGLRLTYINVRSHQPVELKWLDGCVPLNNGMDAFYSDQGVFIQSPGQDLRQIYAPGPNTHPQSISYDGHYLWLIVRIHQQAPQLWVFEPISGKGVQITAEDGLPLIAPEKIPGQAKYLIQVKLATIERGRAIVAGFFGRTWLADVRFNPDGKHSINVFHEAKEIIPPGERNADWKNINLAFQPAAVRDFRSQSEDGVQNHLVVVNRMSSDYSLVRHPLVVDPTDLSIRVSENVWDHAGDGIDNKDFDRGAFFYAGAAPPKFNSIGIVRVGCPDFNPEVAMPGIREGDLVFNHSDGIVNIVGMDWQRGRLENGTLESFGPVPWAYSNHWGPSERTIPAPYGRGSLSLRFIADSNQYGTIIGCSEEKGDQGIFQVLFDGSGVSIKEALNGPSKANSPVKKEQPIARNQPVQKVNLWEDRARRLGLAYSPDGRSIVTVGKLQDKSVQVWDAESGQLLANLLNDPEGMAAVAFSHDGTMFATGGTRGRVIIWDATSLQPIVECEGQSEEIVDLVFSWSDDKVAAANVDRSGAVWTVGNGKVAYEFEQQNMIIKSLGFDADDSRVLAFSNGSTVAWNAENGNKFGRIESLNYVAGNLEDRSLIALAGDLENTLIKWDSTGSASQQLWSRVIGMPVAVSPDGKLLAMFIRRSFVDDEIEEVNRVEVWNLPEKKRIASLDGIFVRDCTFTPNQDALVITKFYGGLQRLELTPKPKQPGPAPNPQPDPKMRTWTDNTGNFSVQGVLTDYDNQQVQLKTEQGKAITVPFDRLSRKDQLLILDLIQTRSSTAQKP